MIALRNLFSTSNQKTEAKIRKYMKEFDCDELYWVYVKWNVTHTQESTALCNLEIITSICTIIYILIILIQQFSSNWIKLRILKISTRITSKFYKYALNQSYNCCYLVWQAMCIAVYKLMLNSTNKTYYRKEDINKNYTMIRMLSLYKFYTNFILILDFKCILLKPKIHMIISK